MLIDRFTKISVFVIAILFPAAIMIFYPYYAAIGIIFIPGITALGSQSFNYFPRTIAIVLPLQSIEPGFFYNFTSFVIIKTIVPALFIYNRAQAFLRIINKALFCIIPDAFFYITRNRVLKLYIIMLVCCFDHFIVPIIFELHGIAIGQMHSR